MLALDTSMCSCIAMEEAGVAAKGLICRENCCDRCHCTGFSRMLKHNVRSHIGGGSDVDIHETSALGAKFQNVLIKVIKLSNKFFFCGNFSLAS